MSTPRTGSNPSNDPADAAPAAHAETPALLGHITHTDFASADPVATREWCARVLGWTFMPPMDMPTGPYHMFRYGASGGGGIGGLEAGQQPGSIPFVNVAKTQEAYDRALGAGAEAMSAPSEVMPGMWIAIVRAPGGVPIGLAGG